MNKRTLKALKGSIQKWYRIAYEDGIDEGATNCPLCKVFYESWHPCSGCPVREKTGEYYCKGSPYYDFQEHMNMEEPCLEDLPIDRLPRASARKRAVKLAEKELMFLVSLLPEGEEWTTPDGQWTYYNG